MGGLVYLGGGKGEAQGPFRYPNTKALGEDVLGVEEPGSSHQGRHLPQVMNRSRGGSIGRAGRLGHEYFVMKHLEDTRAELAQRFIQQAVDGLHQPEHLLAFPTQLRGTASGARGEWEEERREGGLAHIRQEISHAACGSRHIKCQGPGAGSGEAVGRHDGADAGQFLGAQLWRPARIPGQASSPAAVRSRHPLLLRTWIRMSAAWRMLSRCSADHCSASAVVRSRDSTSAAGRDSAAEAAAAAWAVASG